MPYEASTLKHIEDAVSDLFEYHSELDNFLLRIGVSSGLMRDARTAADIRAKQSTSRNYTRGPKRFVVEEVLNRLNADGQQGEHRIAQLVTELINGHFPKAKTSAIEAIKALKQTIERDRQRKQDEQEQKRKRQQELEDESNSQKIQELRELNQVRDQLRHDFEALYSEQDSQKRGYQLEKLLNRLFTFEGFDPRASFKIIGEQIDGSFVLNGQLYLLEAKWTKNPSESKDFGAFMYKLEGKTIDTRGLFVSINGYVPTAVQGLKTKGATRFICIDGAHLHRALNSPNQSLQDILLDVWRHAAETGEAYFPIAEMCKKAG